MAESVDALVSNTSGATHPGSIPGLGTKSLQKQQSAEHFSMFGTFFVFFLQKKHKLFGNMKKNYDICAA